MYFADSHNYRIRAIARDGSKVWTVAGRGIRGVLPAKIPVEWPLIGPKGRRDKLLLVYAARHYCELSNKNQLRPQDLMRILVHYHAYGDPAKAARLVETDGSRLRAGQLHGEWSTRCWQRDRLHAEFVDADARETGFFALGILVGEKTEGLVFLERATES